MEETFFKELSSIQFDGVLLCNVLEHVASIDGIVQRVCNLIKPGGFLIFTSPLEHPVHYNPIDNGYRPRVDEVISLFCNLQFVRSEIVSDHTYSYYLRGLLLFKP